MQETRVQSLGREDPLEKEMQPTPVFLPGQPCGQRSLVGCSPGVAEFFFAVVLGSQIQAHWPSELMLGESLPHLNALEGGVLVGRCKPLLPPTGQREAKAGLMARGCLASPGSSVGSVLFTPRCAGGTQLASGFLLDGTALWIAVQLRRGVSGVSSITILG